MKNHEGFGGNPETEAPTVTDDEVFEHFIDDDEERQDQVIKWLNDIRKGIEPVDDEGDSEFMGRYNGDADEWAKALESELSVREQQQQIIIDAKTEQGSSEAKSKMPLEEIVRSRAKSLQQYIETAGSKISHDKMDELTGRLASMDVVASRIEAHRNILIAEKNSQTETED